MSEAPRDDDRDGPPGAGRRFPRSVYGTGGEPDPRFSLANERTFLSWIRTSLALLAGGVALEGLNLSLQPVLRLVAALLLVVLGILAPVQAWRGWVRDERAMRRGEPLAAPALASPLTGGVALVGVLVLAGLVWR